MTSVQPPPSAPILVTGGTGTLGRLVVARLLDQGRCVRVLSRGRLPVPGADADRRDNVEYVTADVATGSGVDDALKNIETVVHLAGSAKGDDDKARTLVKSATRLGVQHVVFISVVGADRIPVRSTIDRAMFGYFAAKHAAEEVIAQSSLPWTTLRATQFHQATFKVVHGIAKSPICPVPAGWRFQPIDASEVADRLVELTLGKPLGMTAEMGGPQAYDLAELLRSYLRATGKHRLILGMPTPGGAARELRNGANLTPDHAVGHRTWEAFLADEVQQQG